MYHTTQKFARASSFRTSELASYDTKARSHLIVPHIGEESEAAQSLYAHTLVVVGDARQELLDGLLEDSGVFLKTKQCGNGIFETRKGWKCSIL